MLRKIGDTLGVLGLGELRASVQAETERLGKIVAGQLKADETTLVEIAATLIGVEDKLDDQLVGLILPKDAGELAQAGEDDEFQQVQSAVLRECIVNLARIKEAITQNVGGTLDAAGLDSWQDLMRGIKAGLLMLGKARAVDIIEAITRQLKRVMQPGVHVLPPGFVDRLADAIVSVEYYMETLQAGRTDPWYMLDNAQSCVQALEQQQTPTAADRAAARPLGLRAHRADPGAGAAGARARTWPRSRRPRPTLRRLRRRSPRPPVHCRSGADEALHRGGARGARQDPAALPGVGPEPARARRAGHRAPLVPHAQGQRPHGRRARPGRVRLVDREPAQPRARQHAHPLAGDPRDAARRGGRAAAAGVAAGQRRGRERGCRRHLLARARARRRPPGGRRPRRRRGARRRRATGPATPPTRHRHRRTAARPRRPPRRHRPLHRSRRPRRPRSPRSRTTRCATSTRARPPRTSPRCARSWRARRSCPSRTPSPRRCTAPATRFPAARRWRRRATASASPSRSITGCGAPSAAGWDWPPRISRCSMTA